jgi:hypothetical protein
MELPFKVTPILVEDDATQKRIFSDRTRWFVACLMSPPRIGTWRFLTRLEYKYFTPGTPRRDQMTIYEIAGEKNSYWLVGVPAYMRDGLSRSARGAHMKIVEAWPDDLPAGVRTLRVSTLEYAATSPVLEKKLTVERLRELEQAERMEVDKIYGEFGRDLHPDYTYLEVVRFDWPTASGRAEEIAGELVEEESEVERLKRELKRARHAAIILGSLFALALATLAVVGLARFIK